MKPLPQLLRLTNAAFKRAFIGVMIVTLLTQPAFAWSEAGHRIIASIAFRQLDAAKQQRFVDILRHHPRFAEDFEQVLAKEKDAMKEGEKHEWMLQQASIWPDIARGFRGDLKSTFHHSTWHYINLPVYLEETDSTFFAGKLTANVSLHPPKAIVEDMNIVQVIRTSRALLVDAKTSDADKAIMLTWLCHTVGDLHQPLHSTALYSEKLFKQGDRGGNSVKTKQRGNLHSLWDQFPGNDIKWRTARNRALQLLDDKDLAVDVNSLNEEDWLKESYELATASAYAPEIRTQLLEHLTGNPIVCTEDYLKHGGTAAQLRMHAAGIRLGKVLASVLE